MHIIILWWNCRHSKPHHDQIIVTTYLYYAFFVNVNWLRSFLPSYVLLIISFFIQRIFLLCIPHVCMMCSHFLLFLHPSGGRHEAQQQQQQRSSFVVACLLLMHLLLPCHDTRQTYVIVHVHTNRIGECSVTKK